MAFILHELVRKAFPDKGEEEILAIVGNRVTNTAQHCLHESAFLQVDEAYEVLHHDDHQKFKEAEKKVEVRYGMRITPTPAVALTAPPGVVAASHGG